MYSWGDIIPYIIYCANTVTTDALVLFGFSNVMGRYVLQPFMWLFCQFAAEMTFSLLRDVYSRSLIPAFLWVNSAFLVRGCWGPVGLLLGGKGEGMAFCVAGTIYFYTCRFKYVYLYMYVYRNMYVCVFPSICSSVSWVLSPFSSPFLFTGEKPEKEGACVYVSSEKA